MFDIKMKLLKLTQVNQVVPCRHYAKGKLRTRILDYVPWRSREVVDSINETLSIPYKQYVPTSQVRRTLESNPYERANYPDLKELFKNNYLRRRRDKPCRQIAQSFSLDAKLPVIIVTGYWGTNEIDIMAVYINQTNHTLADVGKFYTIPEEFKKRYFALGGIPKRFNDLTTVFNECSIMIRKPALEVIDYMKRADYTKLPVKYLLHGPVSCGKRTTMVHILHYAALNNFVILHMPAAHYLHKFGRKEANPSDLRQGLIDLPLEGALLLKHFQLQNEYLINELNLKTSKEYVWNARESTPVGVPLMELVIHGINRVKYSCDVIDGLIYELKEAATAGRTRLLVAVGGLNSFFAGKTMIRINEKYGTTTDQISIFDSFLKLLQPDWCNGVLLTYVCQVTTVPEYRGSDMPFFLLRREGFEKLDPFVPIYVPELSEMEFHSLLDYYEDRRWLQRPGGREEIEFLTSRKAGDVRDYCAPL